MAATTPLAFGSGHRLRRAFTAVAALLTLIVTAGVATAGTATAQPNPTPSPTPAASPSPGPPPVPLPPVDGCGPNSPIPACHLPRPETQPTPSAPHRPGPPPCEGAGCLPRPTTPAPPSSDHPETQQPGDKPGSEQGSSCGITNITGCVTGAITSFFRSLVTPALNRLLDLLSHTLLTTPTLDQIPQVGQLWQSSWKIMLTCYGMLILIAGITVMTYETLQTRSSLKEMLPRIVIGFLAGALSLWVCTQAITLANALATSIMADGIDPDSAATALQEMLTSMLGQHLFTLFLGLFLVGMLVALLLTYIVRVALTVVLIAGAPLALMLHALPQTEGVAKFWWKAFGGCLAIQIAQSLMLITAMRVFLTPGGYTFFGPTKDGVVNLLVALALMYILFKVPFWILGSLRGGGGKSFVGSLVKGFITYKTFGLLRGGGGGKAASSHGARQSAASPNPYATTRSTSTGQYMLPLEGLKRGRAPKPAHQRYAPKRPSRPRTAGQGKQLALPMDGEWPENKPTVQSDGQYRMAMPVHREPKPSGPSAPPEHTPTGRDQQLRLPVDGEWPENKPKLGTDGQYRLPIRAERVRDRSAPPQAPNSSPRPSRSRQMKLPADGEWPENKPKLGTDGQYQLPLNVRHTPKPAPPASGEQPPPRPKRQPRSRQRSLPLDLPKVSPPRPSPRREGGEK